MVGAVVFASILVERFLPYAVVIAALFWPIRWLAIGKLTRCTPVDWALIVLLAMLPVTLWVTAQPDFTRPQVYRLLTGILFFYALVNWGGDARRLKFMILGIVISGLILTIYGLFSVQWTTWKVPFIPQWIYDYLPSLRFEIIHRNVMAAILVFLLPVGSAWVLFDDRRGRASGVYWFVTGATGAAFLMLILTQGRAAWIAFFIVLLCLVSLRWRWGSVGFLLAAILLGVILLAGTTWFDNPAVDTYVESILSDLAIRGEIWSRAIALIRGFPFTGIGMGTFNAVTNTLYPFFSVSPSYAVTPHAHNLLLQVGVDLGIAGLIAWSAIWLGITACAYSIYRLNDTWVKGLGAGFLGCQMALILHGLTDANTWGMIRPAPIVWVVWGICIACYLFYCVPKPLKV